MKTEVKAVLELVRTVADLIRELESIPSGELYARLMPYGIGLATYQGLIETLVRAGVIENRGHLLTWVAAPSVDPAKAGRKVRRQKS